MKKYFVVSLVKNGILGGGIVADSEAITYHTGKVTVPNEYRKLVMKYKDICEVTTGWIFILPTVLVKMRSGEEYKFAVFFGRKRFVNTLREKQPLTFREMARKKQALSAEQIANILKREKRGVLSVHGENGYPYGLPMNYWYNEENGYIYFHSGKKGHKVDAISSNHKVSFCVYDAGYKEDGDWALNISSVIVFGKMYPVENFEWSMEICRRLSLKYTPDMEYIESEIRNFGEATLCYELRPEHITGKKVKES